MTGKVKTQWGKLIDDDLTMIAGQREQLTGILQQHYGYAKEQPENELDESMKWPKPYIPSTSRDVVINVGPLKATAETTKAWPVPPVLGGLVIACGIVMIYAGARRA